MTANDRAEPGRPTPVTLLQRRGIEAEVLIPLIRRLERELGVERAHAIAREEIASIARQQGETVARALGQDGIEGFRHVRDSWGGAGGDLEITTIREDGAHLDFNVTRCRFAEMYEQLGARDLGFLLSCNRDFTLSEGYSERLHLERTQTIMQGAPFCDFRYRVDAGGARGVDAVAAVDAVASIDAVAAVDAVADSREDTAPETSNAAPEGA